MPGRFLGIACTTGYAFFFIIATGEGITVSLLHRSVVRRRDPKSRDPYADYNTEDPALYEKSDDMTEGSQNNLCKDAGSPMDPQNQYEEIILSDTSPTIVHAGDEGETQPGLKEFYDHFDTELKCMDISDIISSKFEESDGKLYLQVRWRNGQESYVGANYSNQMIQ